MGFRDCTCVPALHDLGAPCMTFTLLFSHISAQREDPCTKIARAGTCSFLPISQRVSVFNFVHLFYTKGLLP